MKIPCVVIDLKTGNRYTIDQFASQLHNGLLKDLVDNKVLDNTNFKGRTELLNVAPKATEEVKVSVREKANKAFESVKTLIKKTTGKDAKLQFAKDRNEMIELVKSHGGTEADATARGYYYAKDGSVVINEEYATTDTAGHEIFHPVLDAIEAHNHILLDKFVDGIGNIKGGQEFIEAAKIGYPTLEGELPKLNDLLKKAKEEGNTKAAETLQNRIDNINRDINQQKKEIITDFFAKISDGTFKVDQSNYEMVRDYILKTLKAMGIKLSEQNLKYLNQKEIVDLATAVSKKFESGEEITAKDLGLDKFEQIGEERKTGRQNMIYGSFEKKGFEETQEYKDLKDQGFINEAFEIKTIAGRPAVTINPDNMITGAIFSEKGTPIIDGNGGIHFVSKWGDVWASSDAQTAQRLADYINRARERDIANGGDGNIHVVVTKGSLGKTLTSHTGSKGSMRVLEYLVDENLIPLSDFRKALNEVGKKYGIEFNGKGDAKTIHAEIAEKFFGVKDSSFESRGYFVKDLIDNLSKNSKVTHQNIKEIRTALNSQEVGRKIAFKYKGVRDAIGSLFADQMTQGVPNSHAYATIEIKEPVEVIAPEANERGSHESYPYHIRLVSGDRPKLNILSESIHIKDLANPIEGKSSLGNDQPGMAEINIKPQFSKSESGGETGAFTTRTGERIGYSYNTDYVARERFDISKLKRLGGGSDRDVFDLGDGKLLKIAKSARGLEQNIYEGDHYLSFVPEVYEKGANYVVVEKAEAPLVTNEGGKELQAMLKDLSQFTQQDFDRHNPKLIETLEKYGLEDAMSYDVIWNDFTAKRNWGLIDGKPVHVDGGTFGGVKMLDRYRGKTNLSDPEFRSIYNESKKFKKQFGDTDKYKQFSKSEVGESINSVNPTGSIFADYTAEERMKAPLGDNMTTLDKTDGSNPNDIITIYRGVPKGSQTEIVGGDFITTNKKLAQDYAGTGVVIEKQVRKGDLLDDKTEPLGEEYLYRPNADSEIATFQSSKSGVGEGITFEPIDFENESENIDVYDAEKKAVTIAKENGVNILRGKDLNQVALDKDGNVIGGLWTEIDGDKFSFDIAINKENQGKGIGEELVKQAIREFNKENYDDNLKYEIDVTNPAMEKILSKYGFVVTDKVGGHTIMEHPTNNPKLPSSDMQFAKSEMPQAPEEVSIKNAAIDEARVARGAAPVAERARQTWGEAWDKAIKEINQGTSPKELAQEIIKKPRAMTDVEHAMLFVNEMDLNTQYWNLIDKINKGEGDIKNLEAQVRDVQKQLEDNEYAARLSGTETARGLAIRRWSKQADYSAAGLKAQARAANKGNELDADTKNKLDTKAKEITEAQDALDKHNQKLEEKKRKEQEDAEKKALKELESKVEFKTATKDEINTYIDKRRNRLADLIAKRDESKGGIQTAKSEAPIDYNELIKKEIKEIAKGYFALGNMDMNSLVKAVHEDLQGLDPSFTERDVRDAISGYKESSARVTKAKVSTEMQDLKKQMKTLSEIEDYNSKNPERMKTTPPKSKALIDLENQYKDKVKEQKLWDELERLENEGLSMPKTRSEKRALNQDIEDLKEIVSNKRKELGLQNEIDQVDQGILKEKTPSESKPLPPELKKLQDELNNKKKVLELSNELERLENEGLSIKTPEEKAKVTQEVADLEKQIAEVRKELGLKAKIEKVEQGQLPEKGQPKEPLPPKLQKLQDEYNKKKRLLELSNQLKDLENNGLSAKTPEEKAAVDQDIQDIQKQIADKRKELVLKGKIADVEQGNLPEAGKPKEALPPELQKLQDEYNKKKRLLEITNEFEEFKRYGSKDKPTTRREVDADVKAIQDQLAEGKRIEAMLKRSWELDNLQDNVNLLQSEIDKLRENGDDASNQLADALTQELNDLIEANKKKPKETKPKSQQEIDARNKVKAKEKELGIDGSDEAKLKAAKTRMQNRIDELQNMIDTGNFDKPESAPVVLDQEGLDLQAKLEEKKREAQMIIEEERRKNMTKTERAIDTFNKWGRATVLSGVHVLFKLPSAGFTRSFIAEPLETLIGSALGKIPGINKVYNKAIAEGGSLKERYKDQAKAMSEWIEGNNWFIDLPESIKKGKYVMGKEFEKITTSGVGTLDEVYGDKKYGLDDNPLEFFGRLHAALKSPTKRAEWLRSYERRTAKALEMGEDVTQGDVQFRIGAEAYIDAQRQIFMGDNAISKEYTTMLQNLERKGNKSKVAAAFLKLLVPVVKIPTNYVLETSNYAFGGWRLIDGLIKGLDNLTPEQSDILIRSLKKQGVGFGMFTLGRMFSNNIGGYYQENEKRGREEVKAGDIKIGHTEIPHWLLHNPMFEIMMMGATYERLRQKAVLEGKSMVESNVEGGFGATTGLFEQIPQIQPVQDLIKAKSSGDQFMNWAGALLNRTVVPQGVKDINAMVFEDETTQGENVSRKAGSFTEQLQKGVPGLQKNIPIKIADYVDVTLGKEYKETISVLSQAGALDDLKDIDIKKYLIYNPTQGTFKPIYLDRTQMNELNQLVRDKFIGLIKENPILSSKNPLQAFREQLSNEDQKTFDKLNVKQQGQALKNMVSNLLTSAKNLAKIEKGYEAYDETKITN